MFLLARTSVYAVPTRILHLKECHLLVIFGMSTQESSVVHLTVQLGHLLHMVIACWYPPIHPAFHFPAHLTFRPRNTAKKAAAELQNEASWRSETPNHSLMGRYFHRIEISMGCRDIYIINNGFYCTLSG